MECPKCKERAITFFDWAKGLEWHKTKCDSCGVSLKCTSITMGVFLSAVFVGCTVFVILIKSVMEDELNAGLMATAIGVLISASIWFIGGYVEVKE